MTGFLLKWILLRWVKSSDETRRLRSCIIFHEFVLKRKTEDDERKGTISIDVTVVELEASPSVPNVGLLRISCWIRYPSFSERDSKIPLEWLSLSLHSYKVKCKEMFLV